MKAKPFQFIPAIDLLDGQVVRLYQGRYDKVTVYNADPSQQARVFLDAGAEMLHIVDLNAAREGQRKESNRRAIQAIAEAMAGRLGLELGGGIRERHSLQECFDLGINRCVMGTAAIRDPDFLDWALAEYGPERIIVGVDVREGLVQVSGWEESSGLRVEDLLSSLEQKGVKEIIFTDISRDGTLSGPGAALSRYMKGSALYFILSGGLSSIKDVQALLADRQPQLVGAISGRAIYENKIDLERAIQMCRTV